MAKKKKKNRPIYQPKENEMVPDKSSMTPPEGFKNEDEVDDETKQLLDKVDSEISESKISDEMTHREPPPIMEEIIDDPIVAPEKSVDQLRREKYGMPKEKWSNFSDLKK